ncbi:MAG: YihY/virulence factor BrkB family protein [Gemmatimonadota bacterium]|jgi:membrane protein
MQTPRILPAFWTALKHTVSEWLDLGVFHWGAALAYYALISLTPTLLLGLTGVGRLFGTEAAKERVAQQAGVWLSPNAESVVRQVLDRLSLLTFESVWVVPTILLLLFGATALFANIQTALNDIWGLKPQSGMVRNLVRTRVMAVLMLGVLAGAVLLSTVLSAVAQTALRFVVDPAATPWLLGRGLEAVVTLTVLTVLLSLTFTILPDARIAWRDVLVGSLFTAVLLYLGKLFLGLYFRNADLGSAFGAAGSVFSLLVWTYYSAQIFLVGAIFTRSWADLHGSQVKPESYATFVETRVVDSGPGLQRTTTPEPA